MYLGLGLALSSGQRASAPAFSPLDLPGLVGWYDFSDSAYHSGVLAANGETITSVNDKSANNLDLGDYGAPTFVASGINGKGSAQFSTGTSMWVGNALNTSACHIFIVCQGGTAGKDVFGTNGTGAPDILLQLGTGPAAKCHYWGDAGLFSNTAASVIDTGSPYILEHIVDATHVRAKSTPDGTEISVAITGTRTTTAQSIVVGSRAEGGGGDSFDGMIGEVIVCAGTDLSVGERASAIAYLTAEWLTPSTSNAGLAMGLTGLTYSA
jgi:hypothetical protein